MNEEALPTEVADAKKWMQRIQDARKLDEPARRQYAIDRSYARGDARGALVSANIVGSFIDTLVPFLYAKNPQVDVLPALSAEPPSMDAVQEAAEAQPPPPEVMQGAQLASEAVFAQTGDMAAAQQAATMAQQQGMAMHVQSMFDQMQQRFQKRQRDNKAFAETLELVITRMWDDGRLKAAGKPWVLSSTTVGVGVFKAAWLERTEPDPEMQRQVSDLQDNVRRVAALREKIEDGDYTDLDAETAEYERQLVALQGQVERVVARGFAVDFFPAEDFQVAPGYNISSYAQAPWLAQRIPMLRCDAETDFSLSRDRIAKATTYRVRKPLIEMQESPALRDSGSEGQITAQDADQFTTGYVSGNTASDAMGAGESGDYVMVWEIWDRGSNHVLTAIEGVQGWVKPAFEPPATSRFYAFFLLSISDVDGSRHPQSLVTRSHRLIDEYNRIGSAEAEHRARVKPKSAFDRGALDPKDADKLTKGMIGEFIGLDMSTSIDKDLRRVLMPVAYPPIDPGLYDRSRIVNELERIWGIQEALAGGVTVDKTATEAEIQQGGFQARVGGRRDAMEDVLSELALYTAEVARKYMTIEDVVAIAGPDAMWPEYNGAESLREMVNVDIRAGSSGKPNTRAEREAIATLAPTAIAMIDKIGTLRNSTPIDIADANAKLLKILFEKSGERIDVDGLLPPVGPPPAALPPEAGAPEGETNATA